MLSSGKTLGPYTLEDLIGSGGMGDVYRAWDSKLSRNVALRVLPEHFSQDAEWLSRFQREAEILASLNHPHIAATYDVQVTGEPVLADTHIGMVHGRRPFARRIVHDLLEVPPVRKIEVKPKQR